MKSFGDNKFDILKGFQPFNVQFHSKITYC